MSARTVIDRVFGPREAELNRRADYAREVLDSTAIGSPERDKAWTERITAIMLLNEVQAIRYALMKELIEDGFDEV